jgi:hypothetical protein
MLKTLYRLVSVSTVLVGLIGQSATPSAVGSAHTLTVSPLTAEVMAGGVARFEIAAIPNATDQLRSALRWRMDGLPKDSAAEFMLDWGDPIDGPVIVRTAPGLRPGKYPLVIVASAESETWTAQVTLNVQACQEDYSTGRFTHTLEQHAIGRRQGGPSTFSYSIGSAALVFCQDTTPRKLRVGVQAATDLAGAPLAKPVGGIVLYRFLQYPPNMDFIAAENSYEPTVEVAASTDQTELEWDVQPGVYLVYFLQHRFPGGKPRPPKGRSVSVTYQLEVLKSKD